MMGTHIATEEAGSATVATFQDSQLLDEDLIRETKQELLEVVDSGRNVVLSFKKVTFMSSVMLDGLMTAEKETKRQSSRLVLCSVAPEIQELFSITKLDQLFQIKKDRQEALAALNS